MDGLDLLDAFNPASMAIDAAAAGNSMLVAAVGCVAITFAMCSLFDEKARDAFGRAAKGIEGMERRVLAWDIQQQRQRKAKKAQERAPKRDIDD